MQAYVIVVDDVRGDQVNPAVFLDKDAAMCEAALMVDLVAGGQWVKVEAEPITNDWMQYRVEAVGYYVNLFEVTICGTDDRTIIAQVGMPEPAFRTGLNRE